MCVSPLAVSGVKDGIVVVFRIGALGKNACARLRSVASTVLLIHACTNRVEYMCVHLEVATELNSGGQYRNHKTVGWGAAAAAPSTTNMNTLYGEESERASGSENQKICTIE